MALNPRKIKDKVVTVDRDIGEAVIIITIYGRRRGEPRTRVRVEDAKLLAIQDGAEVIGLISGTNITNRDGEATGTWVFKIPTIDPENSTTTILKKREKNKKNPKIVIEEDWNLGPEK
jgi:hypothetical protein